LLSFTNQFCRLISFFLTFQIIILLPKAWVTHSLGLSAAEPVQTLQKQVGKRVEFDVDKNLSSQITIPEVTIPCVRADHAAKKVEPVLKKPKIKKLTLEDAINRALEANRGLADAVDNVEGARLSLVAAEYEFELQIFPGGHAGLTGTSGEGPDETLGAGITLEKKFATGTKFSINPNIQKTGDIYQTAL